MIIIMSSNTKKQSVPLQTQFPCPHLPKLLKKQVQSLPSLIYTPQCSVCAKQLNPNNVKMHAISIILYLCLHCGAICCSNVCLQNHLNASIHIFWGALQISEQLPSLLEDQSKKRDTNKIGIMCGLCGSIDEQLLNLQQRKSSSEQNMKKLQRFAQFIHQSIQQFVVPVIVSQFDQAVQFVSVPLVSKDCFGLINLGNTCFLNTVLQVLFHSPFLKEIYQNENGKFLVSKDKTKRRQIQYYYEQMIQKKQNESWHIVSNRKSKGVRERSGLQKFLPSGFVKDSKFNSVFYEFMTNISVRFQCVEKEQQHLSFDPTEILDNLGQFDTKYHLKQQQDAEQLLILLIDVLSQGELFTLFGKDKQKKQRYDKIQSMLGRQKLSPLQQIFGSYLASHIVCLGCGKDSWTVDFTYHLPVSLQEPKNQDSKEGPQNVAISGISYFEQLYYPLKQQNTNSSIVFQLFQPERLTKKQNYYTCEKCSSLVAIKQFYLIDPPQILIVSFKRFQHNKKYKVTKKIRFYEFMQIDNFVLKPKNEEQQKQKGSKYRLYGVIVHKGQTITSGHYVCYIRVTEQIWCQFSDQKVRRVNIDQVLKQEAYILFYSVSQ